jgi:hypothetical protein
MMMMMNELEKKDFAETYYSRGEIVRIWVKWLER